MTTAPNNAPCHRIAMTRDASRRVATHHPECPLSVSLWECENCGARAINGKGHEWATLPDDRRTHACPRLPPRLSPSRAFVVDLSPVEQALTAVVKAMRVWGADGDGIHTDAWDAYAEACRVLGLPAPEEDAQ